MQTATFSPTPLPTSQESAAESPPPALWVSPDIPGDFLTLFSEKWNYPQVATRSESSISLVASSDPSTLDHPVCTGDWFFSVVAPFPTTVDNVSLSDLQRAWFGKRENRFGNSPLLLTRDAYELLKISWGAPTVGGIWIIDEADLLDLAWGERPSWAVIPFDNLDPRWKVIAVDNMNPLHDDFDPGIYPLHFQFCLTATEKGQHLILEDIPEDIRITNRDPDKMTSVVLTGTTALVRYLANRMEINGISYPAEQISGLLQAADILHISNEASFYDKCPPADPVYRESRFCSAPRYFDFFDIIGADVIELTGNHLFDWGKQPFLDTLEIYKQNNLPFYGGGINLEQARQPVLLEHNGNKFAFIGCSPSGPSNVWATELEPGTATCDFEWLENEIHSLQDAGYLVIFTFQHFETDDYFPHSSQRVDFGRVSEAGAVIVSGSQSHFPQTMTFVEGKFVHYGLGNLFFDQMEPLKRNQFVDRHIFYDGRHISTELLTNVLEDYAQPRPMLPEEREKFLDKIFSASNW